MKLSGASRRTREYATQRCQLTQLCPRLQCYSRHMPERTSGTCSQCGRTDVRRTRTACSACYTRLLRSGKVDTLPSKRRTPDEWFALASKRSTTDCWPWPGPIAPNGYGTTSRGWAHRLAYERATGRQIPPGMTIDHTCHGNDLTCSRDARCPHRRCVNPSHLDLVTHAENTRRAAARIRACPAGHAYTDENTVVENGKRKCRECRKQRDRNRQRPADYRQKAVAHYRANRERIQAQQAEYRAEHRDEINRRRRASAHLRREMRQLGSDADLHDTSS